MLRTPEISKSRKLCKMDEFWRPNVQQNDYGQYCQVYLKFPKRVDIKHSYHKIPILTGSHAVICREKLVLKSRYLRLVRLLSMASGCGHSWCLYITEI